VTEDNKVVVDEILDSPGDCFYPFADLRLHRFPENLRVTREMQDLVATALENPCLTGDAYATAGLGLCLWAICELETELAALRRERSSGQDS
jgi:hypothetical protein